MITDLARAVLRWSLSLVVTLLRAIFSGRGRHSGHPVVTIEPAPMAFPARIAPRSRLVPAPDASRAPPALHA
ncbi:hypothetical protein [Actinoplanes sp. OR16]|uniref:hypothetical protein n=1 Tax=Actinoplanes sp. OR16 TaxID=946334 RepID=UPI000FD7F630|nr:hypothetical protein [Actinoplanes sp. OR16]